MLKTRLLGASALVTTLLVGTPAMAGAAPANDATAASAAVAAVQETVPATTAPADEETVTVTGSRIRRPNVEAAVPITSIASEEFFQQAQNNVGDTLNDLPQLRSTFAQQNPGAGVGIAGLNLLDLRGLGTVRTLVLVNGRRHVPADILNNASSPDVNTIPTDLIERVDIVTGGNSAVYGSDAIAGVVNFILRKDFDGAQIRASAGVSSAGFGGNQFISAMAGKNFADGRGNITVQTEYARQERIYASDIPFFRQVNGFVTSTPTPASRVRTRATASRTPCSCATSAARRPAATAWSPSRSRRRHRRYAAVRHRHTGQQRPDQHQRHVVQL